MNDTLVPVESPAPEALTFIDVRESVPALRNEPDEMISRLMYTSALSHFFAGFSPAKQPHKIPAS